MSVPSRKTVREDFGAVLTARLTSAQAVHTDQPTDFGGLSPVVVLVSAGSERKQLTFRGQAPRFYLDCYVFVLSVVRNGSGNPAVNATADDELDAIEQQLAQTVADVQTGPSWMAVDYDGRSKTEFVTLIDGSEYKRELISLALTATL